MNEMVEMTKVRLQVTVREDIVKWVDQQVEKLRFASRSHAIEYALSQLMEAEK
jgi:Arc/MetJ-type ribon-helix-helix transcriptional regulator